MRNKLHGKLLIVGSNQKTNYGVSEGKGPSQTDENEKEAERQFSNLGDF